MYLRSNLNPVSIFYDENDFKKLNNWTLCFSLVNSEDFSVKEYVHIISAFDAVLFTWSFYLQNSILYIFILFFKLLHYSVTRALAEVSLSCSHSACVSYILFSQ
jgi:hypothetical protein